VAVSRRALLALACLSVLLAPPATAPTADAHPRTVDPRPAPLTAATSPVDDDDVTIATAYPNPIAPQDRGEFVVLDVPSPTHLGNWTLSDGETTTYLPNRTVHGRVLVAADVDAAEATYAKTIRGDDSASNVTTLHAPGLGLSNAGETLAVANATGTTVATFAYEDAPAGELARQDGFHAFGETDHRAWTSANVDARTFVLPDTPVPLEPIRRADDRIVLAGYTFSSERTARVLERAAASGVDVHVLVDDAPVGGITRRQLRILDRLAATDVEVRALGGERARYDYQHAKYVVADDTAVVLTENWKPSGTGGHANRGWGVVLDDSDVADDLARVFENDWEAPDARPWTTVATDVPVEPDQPANATYPSPIDSRTVRADAVTVVTAPDNAERVLRASLRNATDRVRVLQMTADRDGVLLEETIQAARRGVDVRILLSSAWYAREENARVVEALDRLAEREDLPLDARLVDPDENFRKLHAKGVVVDDRVVLGSINWNDHSLRENREVAVVIHDDAAATYYADAFDADWERGHGTQLPSWLAIAAALAVLVLLVVLKHHVQLADDR
jgi:phosphatidylserine/phosphatidylglycerophosphate/cardiolipin synthase-like enzyme